ncbi:hypothetical protein [Lacipirellula sp.]|uniref:hypothetical protein n=1 Tax=Lacipirellula sp. TaxID=2691419 RepID=UPI003D0B36B6
MGVTGQKGTLVFTTVAVALKIIEIEPSTEEVSDIACPDLSLNVGDGVPYEPGDLVEGGTYRVLLADDQNTQFVHANSASTGATFKKAKGLKQTVTWTKPVATGNSTGATRAFTGYIKSVKESLQGTSVRCTIELIVKVAGTITKVAGTV